METGQQSIQSRLVGRPLISAAVGAGVSSMVLGEGGSINVMGASVPTWLWVGASVGVADLLSETVSGYIAPLIPGSSATSLNATNTFLPPASAGLVVAGLNMGLGVSDSSNFGPLFVLGAGSVFAGSYINDNFISK